MSIGRLLLTLTLVMLISLSQVQLFSYGSAVTDHLVINEVEANPPDTDLHAYFELYNPTDQAINVNGWKVIAKQNVNDGSEFYLKMLSGTIQPQRFWLYGSGIGLPHSGGYLIMKDSSGTIIDQTPIIDDSYNDTRSWQRVPDGSSNWVFQQATKNGSNSGTQGSKKQSTLTCILSKNTAITNETITVSGSITPIVAGAQVILNSTYPEGEWPAGTHNTVVVNTNIDGKYSTTFKPNFAGTWTINANWDGNDSYLGSKAAAQKLFVSKSASTGCIIITAVLNNENDPEIIKLRDLRTQIGASSVLGYQQVMEFNHFYYSFSPQVAEWIYANPEVRPVVRLIVLPFILSLDLSDSVYHYLDSYNILALLSVNVILSSVITIFYITPIFVLFCLISKRIKLIRFKQTIPFFMFEVFCILAIIIGQFFNNPALMLASSVILSVSSGLLVSILTLFAVNTLLNHVNRPRE